MMVEVRMISVPNARLLPSILVRYSSRQGAYAPQLFDCLFLSEAHRTTDAGAL